MRRELPNGTTCIKNDMKIENIDSIIENLEVDLQSYISKHMRESEFKTFILASEEIKIMRKKEACMIDKYIVILRELRIYEDRNNK